MARRLQRKVALVTGAGQGIGQAIARKMAVEGAVVSVAEINRGKGEGTVQQLKSAGHEACFVPTDITREDDVRNAIETTVERYGGLDVLVNNAGKNFYYDATSMTEDEWDSAMDVDVKGAWFCCKHAIPAMVTGGGGSVVNIASIHARLTIEGMFPYAAAKSAMVGMTRSLALDWAPKNIRVNAVCPGWVRTGLVQEWFDQQPDPEAAEASVLQVHPLGRIGRPEEIANLVAFVASDESSFMTGAELYVDGGLSARFAT